MPGPEITRGRAVKQGRKLEPVPQPELQRRADALKKEGARFFDMTRVFAGEEPLFEDPPCHFNKRGREILARAMADRNREVFQKERTDGGR
jgi:hypothetical protein